MVEKAFSLTIRVAALALALAALSCDSRHLGMQVSAARDNAEWPDAKTVVVSVSGKLGEFETNGAGIVVGTNEDPDRIYILTAGHVVWDDNGRTAQNVKVRFSFLPGEDLPATVLPDRNPGLDLAVIKVSGLSPTDVSLGKIHSRIHWEILGKPSELKWRDQVYPLGHPEGRTWWVPTTPGRYAEQRESLLTFEISPSPAPGHSGGGLFNECHQLVGLVIRSSRPSEAVNIDTALQWLRSAHYPVELEPSPTGACDKEKETRLAKTCTIEVGSQPPGARVYLGGLRRGQTPAALSLQEGQVYDLRLERERYEPQEAKIDCASGNVTFDLKRIFSELEKEIGAKKVTIRHESTPPNMLQVLRQCAQQAGVILVLRLDRETRETPVMIQTSSSTLQELLDNVCHDVCTWEIEKAEAPTPALVILPLDSRTPPSGEP